jgi:hypothetical protein
MGVIASGYVGSLVQFYGGPRDGEVAYMMVPQNAPYFVKCGSIYPPHNTLAVYRWSGTRFEFMHFEKAGRDHE